MSTEKLLKIKSQIDEAKTKQSEIKGQISGVEQQMLSKFDVKELKAAEKKLKEMGIKLDKKEKEFEVGMADLEAAHNWENVSEEIWDK